MAGYYSVHSVLYQLLYCVFNYRFDPSIIPRHPALSLVSMSEQPLSRKHTSRWLITMEKSSRFDSSLEKVPTIIIIAIYVHFK